MLHGPFGPPRYTDLPALVDTIEVPRPSWTPAADGDLVCRLGVRVDRYRLVGSGFDPHVPGIAYFYDLVL